jgi:aspartyl protease family protein
MRPFIAVAAFALAAAVIVPRHMTQTPSVAPSMMAAHTDAPPKIDPPDAGSMIVVPDSQGHFRVEGSVDARHMDFVVDTGATMIALTARDAAMLGIHPAVSDYTIAVRTANGTVRAAPVTLNRVEIGSSIAIRDVAAMVMPEDALSDNLLGMTFLSRLQRYEYSNGRLVLEQ